MERFLVLDKNRLQQSRRGKGSFQLHSFKQLKNRLLVRKQRKGILVMRVEKRMRVGKGMGVEKGMVVMGVRERMLVVKVSVRNMGNFNFSLTHVLTIFHHVEQCCYPSFLTLPISQP